MLFCLQFVGASEILFCLIWFGFLFFGGAFEKRSKKMIGVNRHHIAEDLSNDNPSFYSASCIVIIGDKKFSLSGLESFSHDLESSYDVNISHKALGSYAVSRI